MSSKLEFKGTDVDGAITNACETLRTSREKLQIEVLSTGSSGIFGLLRRQAVVRVSLKGSEEASSAPEPAQKTPDTPAAPPAAEPSPAKQDSDDLAAPPAPVAASAKTARPSKLQRPPRREPTPVPPEYHDFLCTELSTLLTLMQMEAEITVDEVNGKTRLHITGACVEQLIYRDGQALDGLQYLLRKMTSKKLPERAMFIIDADDFRQRRLDELQAKALRLATEVREGKGNRTIPPLSPSERRIVHIALQEDTSIRSRSIGSGLFKKVLIYKPGSSRRRSSSRKKRKR